MRFIILKWLVNCRTRMLHWKQSFTTNSASKIENVPLGVQADSCAFFNIQGCVGGSIVSFITCHNAPTVFWSLALTFASYHASFPRIRGAIDQFLRLYHCTAVFSMISTSFHNTAEVHSRSSHWKLITLCLTLMHPGTESIWCMQCWRGVNDCRSKRWRSSSLSCMFLWMCCGGCCVR